MQRAFCASLVALVLVFVAAFGQPSAVPKSDGAVAMAGPPQRPCVFPTRQELAVLASQSDVVAVGSVTRAQVVHYAGIQSAYSWHTIHVQSVLRGATSSKSLRIEEIGGVPVPILQPGPYVVFLIKSGRTDGVTTYFLADGLNGAFPIRAKGVVRECPTFPATVVMPEATGSGATLADFTNDIRNSPAVAPPPHKQLTAREVRLQRIAQAPAFDGG
jgi:hypothetical protein